MGDRNKKNIHNVAQRDEMEGNCQREGKGHMVYQWEVYPTKGRVRKWDWGKIWRNISSKFFKSNKDIKTQF